MAFVCTISRIPARWRGIHYIGHFLVILTILAVATAVRPGAAEPPPEAELWRSLARGEAVALMRHALAPGTSDPSNFRIGDCATQRNLSDSGRAQARAAGNLMRDNGVTDAKVYTSQWCRCRETAELLGFGDPRELPGLNSLYARAENRDRQVEQMRAFFAALPERRRPHILVSHQVTIRAITGRGLASGAMVVVKTLRGGAIEVLGQIAAVPVQ